MRRILGIIPARKGSKRVVDKNFRDFVGKPLFTYVTEAALKSMLLSDIVVSTDHEDIIQYTHERFRKVIPLKRPEAISTDSAVTVVKLDHMVHPVKMKLLGEQNRLLPFLEEEGNRMTADELPAIYVRNCSVYATRMDTIKSNLIIGQDCRGYLMPPERSVDINEMIDFEFAEFLLKNNKVKLQ